ncbi:MAG TPA: hypothetical protein VGY99_20265 [Candidatus Binataceae bacterium]|jgi:hypothetical protein|nr:hypothetical protein [Candidatus Binataceae bacterium]
MMTYRITALAATAIALVALAPSGWSQMVPETNPALAPARNPSHPTSSESLAAQAQDLTKKINEAKAKGKDTSVASAEQSQGERSMQQGNEQEALRHFDAGEQALGMGPSSKTP